MVSMRCLASLDNQPVDGRLGLRINRRRSERFARHGKLGFQELFVR